MYRSCKYCGRIHPYNYACNKKPTYKPFERKANKFRNTYAWRLKREHIKELDKYMCCVCALNINENKDYMFDNLEVHHIEPLEKAYDKRLDDDNLITLCRKHHEMAEKNQIKKEFLKELIKKRSID